MIITIRENGIDIDIKVNEKQQIKDAVFIIQENGIIKSKVKQIRSLRKKKILETDKSFMDNEIYNGDILILEGEE